jgi:threonine dehydrogenase-like Zn-dependent dehydrogenase
MIEPFACGLHAVLQSFPADEDIVLIIGAGTIGLVTLAALRSLGSQARILVSARYSFQADVARQLGADMVLEGDDLYKAVANETGATLHKPLIGKHVVVGGVDHVFECVGLDSALDDAMRLARAGGKVSLVGVPAITKNVDWSAIFLQELQLNAAYIYNHVEQYAGKTWRTFDLALHLMETGKVDLSFLITHEFALDDYANALKMHGQRQQHNIIKAVFDFREA